MLSPYARANEDTPDFSFSALLPPIAQRPHHCSASYEWPSYIAGLYEEGGVLTKNLSKALEIYRIAALKTDVDPRDKQLVALQYKLGILYINGVGVKQDYVRGYFWVSLAAARSEKYVGAAERLRYKLRPEQVEAVKRHVADIVARELPKTMTETCGTTISDFAHDFKIHHILAEEGDAKSQIQLAWDYIDAYDSESAYFWAAAALGIQACTSQPCSGFLGLSENFNQRVFGQLSLEQIAHLNERVKKWKPQQMVIGAPWLWEMTAPSYDAAHEGDPVAQYDLGSTYWEGSWSRRNLGEAYFWFSVATKTIPENKDFAVRRDMAAGKLSPEELAAVNDRVRTWKPVPVITRSESKR